MLDRVDRFRQERNSGRPVYYTMTAEEWEALLILDEMLADYKRSHAVQTIQLLGSLISIVSR